MRRGDPSFAAAGDKLRDLILAGLRLESDLAILIHAVDSALLVRRKEDSRSARTRESQRQ